jgi:hypothetical protein
MFFNKEKIMKRFLSVVVAAAVLLFAISGCSKKEQAQVSGSQAQASGSQVLKKHKIAVVFTQITTESQTQQSYLANYIAPAFNVEFMFSEAIADADAQMTYFENAASWGAEGLINFQNTAYAQACAKAEELGMYIITNTADTALLLEANTFPHNLGTIATNSADVAVMYSEMVKDFCGDGKAHSVFISTAGAGLGNLQHYDSTVAILQSLRDTYNLKYSDTIENIAASRRPGELDTGRNDIKIYLYPGYPVSDTFVTGVSSILQTGEYDVVLCCNQAFTKMTSAIDEVERAFKFDIKLGALNVVDDVTKSCFATIDSTGDTSLNAVILKPANALVGGMFAILYNGITGDGEKMKKNGKADFYNTQMWLVMNADEYSLLEKVNTNDSNYELLIDEIKQMLCMYNPNANYDSIYRFMDSVTSDYLIRERKL